MNIVHTNHKSGYRDYTVILEELSDSFIDLDYTEDDYIPITDLTIPNGDEPGAGSTIIICFHTEKRTYVWRSLDDEYDHAGSYVVIEHRLHEKPIFMLGAEQAS